MPNAPLDARLEAGLAAGLAPHGYTATALRAILARWCAYCAVQSADPAMLTPALTAGFLKALQAEAACARTAFSRFGTFQVAAALIWGPEATGYLAGQLRTARVVAKPAPLDDWERAARAIAALPDAMRPLFEALMARSRAGRHLEGLVWSPARLIDVATALRRWDAHTQLLGETGWPTAAGLRRWGEVLAAGERTSPRSVAAWLERVVTGYEFVVTPGIRHDGAAAIAAQWEAQGDAAPPRRGGARRTVAASAVYRLGLSLMAAAEAAPVRRLREGMQYRDGLLLSIVAALPERARAVAAFGVIARIDVEPGTHRLCVTIPGAVRKLRRGNRHRPARYLGFENRRLAEALQRWRMAYRPLFDDGAALWPSMRSLDGALTSREFGAIVGKHIERALGVRATIHDLRGCVATERIESDPVGGAAAATVLLGHRDPRTTARWYDLAEGLGAMAAWENASAAIAGDDDAVLAL